MSSTETITAWEEIFMNKPSKARETATKSLKCFLLHINESDQSE